MKAKTPLTLPPISANNDRYISELVNGWANMIDNRNEIEKDFVARLMQLWTAQTKYDRPILIGAEPGLGKSSSLAHFVAAHVRRDISWGAIIVKETLVAAAELAEIINKDAQRPYALNIRGMSSFEEAGESGLDYAKQFDDALNYPVVIITTKMLEVRTVAGDLLEKLQPFNNLLGECLKRRVLIIDEPPTITREASINLTELNKTTEATLNAISSICGSNVPKSYRKLMDVVKVVRSHIEALDNVDTMHGKPSQVLPFDRDFTLPRSIHRAVASQAGHEVADNLTKLEKISCGGGLFESRFPPSIINSTVIEYPFEAFDVVTILDGTSDRDMNYHAYETFYAEPAERRRYENVTIYECDELNFSRSFFNGLESGDGSTYARTVENIAEFTNELAAKHDSTILFCATKTDTYKVLQRHMASNENVKMKYFDSGRGSNMYEECSTGIFFGALLLPSLTIAARACAIFGETLDVESHTKKGLGLYFSNDRVDEYFRNDLIVRMIQETYRLRAGKEPRRDVAIYISHASKEVRDGIAAAYPGCKRKRFYLRSRILGQHKPADKIAEFISNMKPGEAVKSSVIQKVAEIKHRRTMKLAVESPRVQDAMKENRVVKEKTKFIKPAEEADE